MKYPLPTSGTTEQEIVLYMDFRVRQGKTGNAEPPDARIAEGDGKGQILLRRVFQVGFIIICLSSIKIVRCTGAETPIIKRT